MVRFLSLNLPGILAAFGISFIILYFGGEKGWAYLLLLFIFLVSGALVTWFGEKEKRERNVYETERGWKNVLANGIVPTLCIFTQGGGYFGAVAAITADKFASEMGVTSRKPIFLLNFKEVEYGTSGAVTLLGLFASFVGGLVIGVASHILFPEKINIIGIFIIGAIGFFGSFFDSLLGILETKGIGNKETTNIACSIFGALVGEILLRL